MNKQIFLLVVLLLSFIDFGYSLKGAPKSPYPYYSTHRSKVNLNVNDPEPSPYTLLWYNQTLDHFNFNNQGTFQQRVFISDTYWNVPNSDICSTPMIFFCGNEGDLTFFYESSGFVTNTLAQEMSALIVFAEHRYYGQTLPFGNSSYTNENFQYLTAEQALADYAALIPYILEQYNASHCPVFTTSGSYGGDLAAWMRLKYPNIVDGALASSAPLLYYIGTGVSYDTFTRDVTVDFAETSSEGTCAEKVRVAFQDMILLVQQSQESGLDQLTQVFKLCEPLLNQSDFENFLSWAETAFNYMAMADYPYPCSFLEPMPGYPVNYTCNLIAQTDDSFQVIQSALSVYFNYTGNQQCFDINVFLMDNDIMVPWDYQSCTEIVTPLNSTGISDFFFPDTFNLTYYIESCQEQYGVTPNPYWITSYLSGKSELFPSSNIIFSNGELDPWHNGGIKVSQPAENIIAILIPGAAHHLDLRSPNPLDPPGVTQARELEIKYLTQWAQEAAELKSKIKN